MEQLDTREKLWKLESEALKKSEEVNNPYWIMCYKNLAMALSTLDAFIARSSDMKLISNPVKEERKRITGIIRQVGALENDEEVEKLINIINNSNSL